MDATERNELERFLDELPEETPQERAEHERWLQRVSTRVRREQAQARQPKAPARAIPLPVGWPKPAA